MPRDSRNDKPKRPVRVVVVDDDPRFAEMLAVVLGDGRRIAIVGMAHDGAEGVQLALRLQPDVVVMDVQMPVMDGIEATRQIRSRSRSARVVVITGDSDPALEHRAHAAGAACFLRKSCEPQVLREAVTTRQFGSQMMQTSDVTNTV